MSPKRYKYFALTIALFLFLLPSDIFARRGHARSGKHRSPKIGRVEGSGEHRLKTGRAKHGPKRDSHVDRNYSPKHRRPHNAGKHHRRNRHHRSRFSFHFGYPYGSYSYRSYYRRRPTYYYSYYGRPYYYGYPRYQSPQPVERQKEYEDKFADVRERIKNQQPRISQHLDQIADRFVAGNYRNAIARAAEAIKLEPESAALRFAYSQALFANGEYERAARVLRLALKKVNWVTQPLPFYPLDFYPNQSVLDEQIDRLSKLVETDESRADLKLLLGWHLMGAGRPGDAEIVLQQAATDRINAEAAQMLLTAVKDKENTVTMQKDY